MRLSLIVTTHARPGALARVLESVANQSAAPDELIVAEDGSDEATARVVDTCRKRLGYRVRHVRQAHAGFRVARLRNLALLASTADYVVFVDGDMVLDREFLADHRAGARPGWFMQGTRLPLDEVATSALLAESAGTLAPRARSVPGLRRIYALRSPRLSRLLQRPANAFVAIKSCNLAAWRADLERINGYEETICGWGYEDKELCARLGHAGVRRGTLLFSALAWHLAHDAADRSRVADNRAIYARTVAERRVRARVGLDGHAAGSI